MRSRFGIQLVVAIGIAALFAAAAIRTHNPALPNIGDVGKALTGVLIMVGLYDRFLWRLIPAAIWQLIPASKPPRLYGTWKMLLRPEKGPEGASLEAKPCYLSVDQTASKISARILFVDGESKATTAVLGKDRHGDEHLLLFYDFDPKKQTNEDPPRKGAVALRITEGALNGKYWNDFGISGDLTSSGRTPKKTYKEYDEALQGGKYT